MIILSNITLAFLLAALLASGALAQLPPRPPQPPAAAEQQLATTPPAAGDSTVPHTALRSMAARVCDSVRAVAAPRDSNLSQDDDVTRATCDFLATGVARVVHEGSVITFPYGHSQPTVTCARLRACVIELQPGETVLSRIAGDLTRWEIVPAAAGPGGRTTLVVVKPKDCDLTTNLVLATDRRIYDLTLDAPPCPHTPGESATNPEDAYTRRVTFYYPDQTVAQWLRPAPPRVPADVAALDFDYRVYRDKHFPWQPAQVFDDGAHVYIKLPEAAEHREAPALFVVAEDGSRTLLNYSVIGDTYVTDRLFHRAVLVAGVDGKERDVAIERRNAP
jgi:type IV secretion system protein TrbG